MGMHSLRRSVWIGSFLIAAVGMPRPSEAIFHWFCHSCAPAPAPAVVQYAPAATTCTYMPQTCYRTAYVYAPVTAYRPVATCDPCSGCPTTVMHPVVSYAMRPQLVPYTTYYPMYGTMAAMPATSYYAPVADYAAPNFGTGCGSCQNAAYGTPTMGAALAPAASASGAANVAPALTGPVAGKVIVNGASSVMPGPVDEYPAAADRGTSTGAPANARSRVAPRAPGKTFKDANGAEPDPPAPAAEDASTLDDDEAGATNRNKTNNTQWPRRLFDPSDRTTSRAIHRTALRVPLDEPASTTIDGHAHHGGWRPAQSAK